MATYPELSGKIAVVSGASGNLGAAVVRRLYAEKVRLALIDRNEQSLRETLRAESIDDRDILVGKVDLTHKGEVDRFIEQVAEKYGRVDIMVNTAGGYKPGKPVHEMDEAFWKGGLDFNAKNPFFFSGDGARAKLAQGTARTVVEISGKAG